MPPDAAEDPVPPAEGERDEELGGDAACWAHRVCSSCGRLADREHPRVCAACGAEFPHE